MQVQDLLVVLEVQAAQEAQVVLVHPVVLEHQVHLVVMVVQQLKQFLHHRLFGHCIMDSTQGPYKF